MAAIAAASSSQNANLTADQQAALKRLHQATQQFEGVFLGMLFKAMRATVPQDGLFGGDSPTSQTFTEMLDDQRAQQLATSGTIGIAKIMEEQLRAATLANAARESKAAVPQGFAP
jgi:flagellar protein FlgJ